MILPILAASTLVGGFTQEDLNVLTYLVRNSAQHCTLDTPDYCQIAILGKPLLAKLDATSKELAKQEAAEKKSEAAPSTTPNPAKPK